MRRNASRSRGRVATDDDDVKLALQRLVDKLRSCQPFYREEDVAVIPYPGDGGGSPSRSPTRSDDDHHLPLKGEAQPPQPSPPSQPSPSPVPSSSLAAAAAESRKGTGPKTQSQSQSSGGATVSATAPSSTSASAPLNLDLPLSAPLFLTAVNLLEPQMIGKSRRATLDAVKLVKQGYGLVWRDQQYFTDRVVHTALGIAAAAAAVPVPVSAPSSRANSPGLSGDTTTCVGGGVGDRDSPAISPSSPLRAKARALASRSPAPTFRPPPSLVRRLDAAVQSLLVYANDSFFLSQYILSQETVLRVFCFVCWAARQAEKCEGDEEWEDSSSSSDSPDHHHNHHRHRRRPPTGAERRDLDRELAGLAAVWAASGLAGRIVDCLRECYLAEFLLDACLPPAVCTSRYDGLTGALHDRKQRILTDMVTSRLGFAAVVRAVPLRGLAGIAAMAHGADARLRARLLDRLASVGIVGRLFGQLSIVCSDMSAPPPLLPPPLRLGSATSASQGKRPRSARTSPSRVSPERAQARAEGGKSKGRPTTSSSKAVPAAATTDTFARQQRWMDGDGGDAAMPPVERLGYVVDLLLLLTSPNLRPPSEADEVARNPKTAAGAVVRATVWATADERILQGIAVYLLWVVCNTADSGNASASHHHHHPRLSSLRATAAECVLQLAAYSGVLYAVVVAVVDALFKGTWRRMLTAATAAAADRSGSGSGGLGGRAAAATASSLAVSPPRSPSPRARGTSQSPPTTTTTTTAAAAAALSSLAGVPLEDPAGLLPLIVSLLRYPTHALANTSSVRRWLRALADGLLPSAFEAPRLTNGRRSTAGWGRARVAETAAAAAATRSPSKARGGAAGGARLEAPVLARDLTRAEVASLSPYFTFAVRLVTETPWRDGAEPFLAKMALVSYHVVLAYARRSNLCFGQASTCYDLVAPMLLPVGGIIPGDSAAGTPGGGTSWAGSTPPPPPLPSSAASRKRRRSRSLDIAVAEHKAGDDNDGDGGSDGEGEDEYHLFIPSPSRSPVFYEAYSPAASEITFISDQRSPTSPVWSSLSPPSLPASPTRALALDEAFGGTTKTSNNGSSNADDAAAAAGGGGASPRSPLTRSWRHSLQMLISSIGGSIETELKKD